MVTGNFINEPNNPEPTQKFPISHGWGNIKMVTELITRTPLLDETEIIFLETVYPLLRNNFEKISQFSTNFEKKNLKIHYLNKKIFI